MLDAVNATGSAPARTSRRRRLKCILNLDSIVGDDPHNICRIVPAGT